MSNDYSGNYVIVDGAAVSSPASPVMSVMLSGNAYYRELGVLNNQESDVVDYNVSDYFLVRISRQSFELSKLTSQFSFTAKTVGGQYSLRLVHKQLGTYYTLEEALAACGLLLTGFAENWAGPVTDAAWISMNTVLAPHGLQVWRI